jgi:repressor of nif and glnA expression
MPEMGRKEFAVLRVLGTHDSPVGATVIARELRSHGIELTERAVRYHLQALDERGLTTSRGRAGRQLTDAGRQELAQARVADKVALVFARMETLAYQTSFDLQTGEGKVVLNVSLVRQTDLDAALRAMRAVFISRYATSDLYAVMEPGQRIADQVIPRGHVGLGTVCSVTINGILLQHGIPVHSQFGGILEIAGHEPARFTEVVEYGATSVDPVKLFISSHELSVGKAAETGHGKVGAGFRTCPAEAREDVLRLVDHMGAWRIRGVIAVGATSQPLLEIPVDVGRMAFVVCAGLNPVAAATEYGIEITNMPMAALIDYSELRQV